MSNITHVWQTVPRSSSIKCAEEAPWFICCLHCDRAFSFQMVEVVTLPEPHDILEGEFPVVIADRANVAAHEVVVPGDSDIELRLVLLSGNEVVILEGQRAELPLEEGLYVMLESGYEVLFNHCAMHLSRGEGQGGTW